MTTQTNYISRRKETNEQLIKNIKLVNKMADNICLENNKNPEDFRDKRQLAYLLFLKYYGQYNKSKSKLSTWINSSLKFRLIREFNNSKDIVRLPVYVQDIIRRYNQGKLTGKVDEDIKVLREINNSSISKSQYEFIKDTYMSEAGNRFLTLEEATIDSCSAIDKYHLGYYTDLDESIDLDILSEKMARCIKCLPKLQQDIIKMNYGIGYSREDKTYSVEEISNLFGMSVKKITSQKYASIEKLRRISTYSKRKLNNLMYK